MATWAPYWARPPQKPQQQPPPGKKNPLRELMLSKVPPTRPESLSLYTKLAKDDSQIIELIKNTSENHHFREALLANPDELLPRLSSFLRSIKLNIISRNPLDIKIQVAPDSYNADKAIRIPTAFTEYVILPLLKEQRETFDISSAGFRDFILTILETYIPLAAVATVSLANLKRLFSEILTLPFEVYLFERLVVETTGANLLAQALESNHLVGRVFPGGALHILGHRLAKLSGLCVASHGTEIEDCVSLWEDGDAVRRNLEEHIRQIEATHSHQARGKATIHLSAEDQDFLEKAKIAVPYNITTTKSAIEDLESRYRDQIIRMASGFPCSSCKARLSGVIPIRGFELSTKRETADIKVPFGLFPIRCSDSALKELKRAQVDGTLSQILAVLQKLANGMWEHEPTMLSKLPLNAQSRVIDEPILRAARWCEDGFILWERGVGRLQENVDDEETRWIQIVKIIQIGSKDSMKAAVSAGKKAQRVYNEAYRKATAVRLENPDRPGTLQPKSFIGVAAKGLEGSNMVLYETSSKASKLSPGDALILHKALCTGKQYELTRNVADMILQGGHQVEVPFLVSREEESIIHYLDSSICILGRSGTGKTTCLVFKLLANYIRDRVVNVNNELEVRQVLLTRSPVLASKIRQYTNRLINSHFMRFQIEINPLDIDSDDSDLGPDDHEEDDAIGGSGILDIDDKGWPLICTFDRFAAMLESNLKFARRDSFNTSKEMSAVERGNRRVDFRKFSKSYWPSFNTAMKKGLAVDGVFSEIMGVIKATSSAADHQPLSEKQYQDLSTRVAPNYSPGPERETVYRIYELYERRKRWLDEWDDLDRTAKIHKLLMQNTKLSSQLRSRVTQVFVDEIQDQRLPEIELLLDLVNNVKSFAFAGDTAQCISRDSCFRFQDLKNLFYQKYQHLGNLVDQKDLAKLKLITLAKNYRTHNGILKLAAKVVDTLVTYFPYVIDRLSPELGDFEGPAPIVFAGFSSEIFIPRKTEVSSISEFGADQVLIVRDEEAKSELVKEVGSEALILTILESKGMEFQDVFLFNFFSASPCIADFRALSNSQVEGTRFDDVEHASLCPELKNLYVAVTRPREMLYIIESSSVAVRPIVDMWGNSRRNPLVDVVHPDDPTLQTRLDEIRVGQSTKEEWKQKAKDFFDQRMYEQAMFCYNRAGDQKLKDLCEAHVEEQNGRDIVSEPNRWEDARAHYLRAADLFQSCDRHDRAVKCFESIREYFRAGEICERLSKMTRDLEKGSSYLRRAADFYIRADALLKAIDILGKLKEHEAVLSLYRKVDAIEGLIEYLRKNKNDIERRLYHQNARIVAVTVFSSASSGSATSKTKKSAISLLGPIEQEQLYRQFNFLPELEELLISQNRLVEAIQIPYSQGRWKKVGLLLRGKGVSASLDSPEGEEMAERVLWNDLTQIFESMCRPGKLICIRDEMSTREFEHFPGASKLIRGVAILLDSWFLGTKISPKDAEELLDESMSLSDMLVLQQFYSSRKPTTYSPGLKIKLIDSLADILIRSLKLLSGLRANALLSKALIVFLQALPVEDGDEYTIPLDSLYNDPAFSEVKASEIQQVKAKELLRRAIVILELWTVNAYLWYCSVKEAAYKQSSPCPHFVIQGYCNAAGKDCSFGRHDKAIKKEIMLANLELAWEVSILTPSFDFVRNSSNIHIDFALSEIVRQQGHAWFMRISDGMIASSDLLQWPSRQIFLIEKRAQALIDREARDPYVQQKARMELKCIEDNFEWRVRRITRKLREGRIWDFLGCWERIWTLKGTSQPYQFNYLEKMWRGHCRALSVKGHHHGGFLNFESDKLMILLYGIELCAFGGARVNGAMVRFSRSFTQYLSRLPDFNELHLLLNRLDRVTAIILFLASPMSFIAKISQIEFLRTVIPLDLKGTFCGTAGEALNSLMRSYNLLWDRTFEISKPTWYKEAMRRRIELSGLIAILNTSNISRMVGAREFMDGFLDQASSRNFWVKRMGNMNINNLPKVPKPSATSPVTPDKFIRWVLDNLEAFQSPADPLTYCFIGEAARFGGMKDFGGSTIPVVQFRDPDEILMAQAQRQNSTEDSSQSDQEAPEVPDKFDPSPAEVAAAKKLQKNWRIYSINLERRRYLEQDPWHRRITLMIQHPILMRRIDNDLSRRKFRATAFVLLELIAAIKTQLTKLKSRYDALGRKSKSMLVMEQVMAGYEIIEEFRKRLLAVESVTAKASLEANIEGAFTKAGFLKSIALGGVLLGEVRSQVVELDEAN